MEVPSSSESSEDDQLRHDPTRASGGRRGHRRRSCGRTTHAWSSYRRRPRKPATSPAPLEVVLRVNGTEHRLTLDPRTTLLDALREHLHLTGSKKGCGLGQCGACTVLMDGKRVKVVPFARRTRRRARDHDHRGPGPRRATPSLASRLHRARRLPVRLLHAPDRSWPASPASTRATPARRRKSATG